MSTVQEIETALAKLPLEDKEAIRDWLDEIIEDQLEISDQFKAKVQRARQEITREFIPARANPAAVERRAPGLFAGLRC